MTSFRWRTSFVLGRKASLYLTVSTSYQGITMVTCFNPPLSLSHASFTTGASSAICTRATTAKPTFSTPRAAANDIPPPGIPSGQDPLDGAPMRHFVNRPIETYEDRGFATVLPRGWAGEVPSVGVTDIEPVTKESIEEARKVRVDAAATGAFVEYSRLVKDEREAMLAEQAKRNAIEGTGRPTCGEEEGKEFVSNYQPILVDGVKCVEYWGEPNGPVPRLFGGPES